MTISVFKLIFLHTVSAVSGDSPALFQYSILTKVDACKHEHCLLMIFYVFYGSLHAKHEFYRVTRSIISVT